MDDQVVTLAPDSKLKLPSAPAARQENGGERLLKVLLDVSLPAGDLLAINCAFLGAYFVRYILQLGGQVPGEFDVSYQDYIPVQAAMTVIFLAAFVLKGMYRVPRSTSIVEELSGSLNAT